MKLFVWDFHGVLEKGTGLSALEISNQVLKEQNIERRFEEELCNKLFGKKWYEYFEHLLPEESHERHHELQELCFAHEWNNSDHHQVLISNTKPEKLEKFIEYVEAQEFFNEKNAFGVDDHVKDSKRNKLDVLMEYLEGKNYDEIIIIGDGASDMELKKVAGGKTYLYLYEDRPDKDCEADFRIRDLREILKEI